MPKQAIEVVTFPNAAKVNFMTAVFSLLKLVAWLVFLGGLFSSIVVHKDRNTFVTVSPGAKNLIAAGIAFGGLVTASLWGWMAYVLEALTGMWTIAADQMGEEVVQDNGYATP